MKIARESGSRRIQMGWLVLCMGFLSGLSSCSQEQAKVPAERAENAVRIAGTRVSLVLPAGFSRAPSFAGLVDIHTGVSLMITEMPAPYDELSASLNERNALRAKNMEITDREPFPQGSYPGLLMQVKQKAMGMHVRKWMWIFGDESKSVLVLGTCPEESFETEYEKLGIAVRSVTWEPNLSLDLAAELDFYLQDTGGMQILNNLGMSLTYTSDGKIDKDGNQGKPAFIITPSIRPTSTTPLKTARRRMRLFPGYKKVKPGEFGEITIDGLTGYEGIASAIHRKSGEEAFIYQVMLFEGTSYWLLVGTGRAKDRHVHLPTFKRMAASFTRRFETLVSSDGLTSVETPSNWTPLSNLSDDAELQAGHAIADNYLIVMTEPKSDFDEGYTFEEFTRTTRASLGTPAQPPGEDQNSLVNGLQVNHSILHMDDETGPIVYLHATIAGAQHYHQLLLWCLPDGEPYSLPAFQRILKSFREIK